MRYTFWLLLMLAAALTVAIGCSEDSTAPADTQSTIGLLEGEIGNADFEISVDATGDSRRRFEGPFVLRGSNLHYVDSLQALSVDLTITNRGEVAHAEPIGLTFVKLVPEGVTVQNPDNGINGEGAAITFAFANDDGQWTPGESSLPRTVLFGVEPGRAVGFIARLDIGEPIDGGSIAGRLWHDANQDGVMDLDEGGIPGVQIALRNINENEDPALIDTWRFTRTDFQGLFAFHQLRPGVYVVGPGPNRYLMPTTPTEMTVLLTEIDNDVSDFTDANFGAVPLFDPPDSFPLGAFAVVRGAYVPDPDRVRARDIELKRCALTTGDDDDGVDCRKGILRGSVTAVDGGKFAIMGTWVTVDAAGPPFQIEVGQRLDVSVHHAENTDVASNIGDPVVDHIQEWAGEHDEVHGRIQRVDTSEEGVIRLRVLDTLVVVMRDPSMP